MTRECWRGCVAEVVAEPVYHGQVIYTCWQHHPYRKRLFVRKNLSRLFGERVLAKVWP